jgi:glutathione S-transferase
MRQPLRLIIANRNYSSWSFRPWLAMKVARIPFADEVIDLSARDFASRVKGFSGSGKLPVLLDGDVVVWESLAILEYLAEKFPRAALWPGDPAGRAKARAVSAEMHAGFGPLRSELPMNMRRPVEARALGPAAKEDVRRIEEIWTDCRRACVGAGDFLFGTFGAADAMYAPVVSRLHTYGIAVGDVARAYMAAMIALPEWQEWVSAARAETSILPQDEVDWPTVRGI